MINKLTGVVLIFAIFQETLGSSEYQFGLGCEYHGQKHNIGDSWAAIDGYNTCSCHAGKLVVLLTCTERPCGASLSGHCTYEGTFYHAGESFPSIDKCNTCFCSENGAVACTEKACLINGNRRNVAHNEAKQRSLHCSYDNRLFNIGETWLAIDGCNTCSCHAGDLMLRVTCTKDPCVVAGACVYNGQTYKVGDSFQSTDKCNTCGCTENGGIVCTQRFCIPNGIKRESLSRVRDTVEYQFGSCHYGSKQYQIGQSWTAHDGCNNCSCHASGEFLAIMTCSERPCAAGGYCMYNGQSYKVGEHFQGINKCSTCACTQGGYVVCSTIFCGPNANKRNSQSKSRKSTTYQRGFHCRYDEKLFNIGETWAARDGCNNCSCHAGDLIVRMTCTENPCGIQGDCVYGGKSYNVGDSFLSNDKCNTCGCTENGGIVCTQRVCLLNGNVLNGNRRDLESRGACLYNGQSYKVGESFQSIDKCNTCGCTEDGNVVCTEMFCLTLGRKRNSVSSDLIQCTYHGQTYNSGESFPSVDKCNTCYCIYEGSVVCTKRFCIPNGPDGQ